MMSPIKRDLPLFESLVHLGIGCGGMNIGSDTRYWPLIYSQRVVGPIAYIGPQRIPRAFPALVQVAWHVSLFPWLQCCEGDF